MDVSFECLRNRLEITDQTIDWVFVIAHSCFQISFLKANEIISVDKNIVCVTL